MITYTGSHVTKEFGCPNIRDMAVQSMRICRFAGAGRSVPFWPVGLHSMLVADIIGNDYSLRAYALLHDVTSEVCTGDPPVPMKTDDMRTLMNMIDARTYAHLGLPSPTEEQNRAIKAADWKAVHAEGFFGCGPRGYEPTQYNYEQPDAATAGIISGLLGQLKNIGYDELFNPDGFFVNRFEHDIYQSIKNLRQINEL